MAAPQLFFARRRRVLQAGTLLLATVAVGASAGWTAGRQAVAGGDPAARLLRQCLALLQDSERLRRELRSQADPADAAGLLPSYLALIRRDGVPRHAALKQRLDRICSNDAALAALLAAHAPSARRADFGPQAERFRDYAVAWRDRWNSVMELLMAGGSYPAQEPEPPEGLTQALQDELAAA